MVAISKIYRDENHLLRNWQLGKWSFGPVLVGPCPQDKLGGRMGFPSAVPRGNAHGATPGANGTSFNDPRGARARLPPTWLV